MRRRLLVSAAVLLVTTVVAGAPAQESVASSFDDSELRVFAKTELMKLAEAAAKRGDATVARRAAVRLFSARLSRDSQHQRRAMELAALEDSPKLSAKTHASLEDAFRKVRAKIAARFASVAAKQVPGPGEELAQMLAREAVEYDPECAPARSILGDRRLKGWGWVDADTADRLDAGEVEIGGEWRPRMGLGKDPRPWGEEWVVRSDHFVVRSNLPLKRVFQARDLLESLRERFLADWEGLLPLSPSTAPHEVLVFATEDEYAAYLRENDPQHVKGVPGQYSPNLRRSMFFDVETLRSEGGATSSLVELMLHECAHQLVYELVAGNPQALEGADSPNHWLNEGLAEYYGMHTPSKRAGLVIDRKAIRGMLRTRQVKDNLAQVPAASVMAAMTRAEFHSPDGNQRVTHYAAAGFLCLHLSWGATRGGWQRLVRSVFVDGNPKGAWAASFGAEADAIDTSFAKYLRSL